MNHRRTRMSWPALAVTSAMAGALAGVLTAGSVAVTAPTPAFAAPPRALATAPVAAAPVATPARAPAPAPAPALAPATGAGPVASPGRDRPFQLGGGVSVPGARAARSQLTHTVTIDAIDQDGNATAPGAALIDLSTGVEASFTWTGSALTATVAPGDYTLTVAVASGPDPFNPTDVTFLSEPTLTIAANLTLTVDARQAALVHAQVPVPTAARLQDRMVIGQVIAGVTAPASYANGDADTTLHAFPSTSTTTRDYAFVYLATHAEPLSLANPRAYFLAFPTTGRVPAPLTFTPVPASLATVTARYTAQGVPSTDGLRSELMVLTAQPYVGGFDLLRPASAPKTVTEYFSTGMSWRGNFFITAGGSELYEEQVAPRAFTAGASYTETWDAPAFGPTIEMGHGASTMVFFGTAATTGQTGRRSLNPPVPVTATMTLRRNGVLVGSASAPWLYGEFTVPSTLATFRLDLTMTRSVGSSTYVTTISSARWTFKSSGAGDPLDSLRPLLQIRASGAFDLSGRAPKGTTFPLDVRVIRPAGGGAITSISLQVSFNDGASWTSVALSPNGTDRWSATVSHPWSAHNGFVGLRFSAGDGAVGNQTSHTTLRAYGLI